MISRFLARRYLSAALAAAALLTSCGSDDGGRPQIEASERQAGAEQHPQLLAEFGGSYDGQEARYLARIGEKLAAAADLDGQCTFTLVNSDVVNAFAVPGCYIYVTRGLMGIVNSEAELASILSHELGHIVGDHSERQQKRSLLRSLGVVAVSLLTGSERLTRIAGQAAQYFTLRYSRNQEYQSDDLGIKFMAAAGYDPYAAADMLAQLAAQERFMSSTQGHDEARSIPEWARTHPLTENRVSRARTMAQSTGIAPDALPENEAGYLEEVDGLLYGDDPQQGFVIGRRFAHPMMRIRFEAPPGFTLTNSPQAILINGPDGARGEFGGAAMPAGGLEEYASNLIGQMLGDAASQAQIGQPEARIVNGVRALVLPVTVQTAEGSVEIRVAAYQGSARGAYHFIMVAPSSAGQAVEELFGSFHLLSAQEVASLRPREIEVRQVQSGERLQDLASLMASDQPLEHFLMINGRSKDQPLQSGDVVKLIRYRQGSPEQ